jgi:hypothetical protein
LFGGSFLSCEYYRLFFKRQKISLTSLITTDSILYEERLQHETAKRFLSQSNFKAGRKLHSFILHSCFESLISAIGFEGDELWDWEISFSSNLVIRKKHAEEIH